MTDETKQTLEEKTKMYDRLKYASPGLVAAGVGAMGPEIKEKYDSLPTAKQDKLKTYAKVGAGVLVGGLLAYLLAKK